MNRPWSKRLCEDRKRDGVCVRCGGRRDCNYLKCSACREKTQNSNSRFLRKRYAERKASGVCTRCGSTAVSGLVHCSACALANNENRRRWERANRKHVNAYRAGKRKYDKHFLIATRLRVRMCDALASYMSGSKKVSAVKDLGCTIDEFVSYFEKLMSPGMSWANHGEWQIDHIKPLMSFDLTDPEQQRQACHYTNLQPLWARDNYAKRNREYAALRRAS